MNPVIPRSSSPVAAETKVVGRRVAAFLVDNVVMVVLILLCAIPYLLVLLNLDPAFYERSTAVVLVAMFTTLYSLVVLLGITIGYYALPEGYRGQTVGKMLFGLEVIREENGRRSRPEGRGFEGPYAPARRRAIFLASSVWTPSCSRRSTSVSGIWRPGPS